MVAESGPPRTAAPGWTTAGLAVLVLAGLWFLPAGLRAWREAGVGRAAAPAACDPRLGCEATFADGVAVHLQMTPGASAAAPVAYAVQVRGEAVPTTLTVEGAEMDMGVWTTPLTPVDVGAWTGSGSLPYCSLQRMVWRVSVALPGRVAEFTYVTAAGGDDGHDHGAAAPKPSTPPAPEPTYADFTVESATGPLALASLRGQAVVVYFGYTSCPDICPTTLSTVASARKRLPPEQAARVTALLVTVDPERDTPARLGEYIRFFDPAFHAGAPASDVLPGLAADWGVVYRRAPIPGSALGYAVDHSTWAFLVGPEGERLGKIEDGTAAEALSVRLAKALD